MVEGTAKGYSQCHGELMFTAFKPTVSIHLAKVMTQTVPVLCEHAQKQSYRVMSVLVTIVDTVSKDKNMRKQYASLFSYIIALRDTSTYMCLFMSQ